MSALPTSEFVAVVGGILAASAPISPDAIAAWIRRAAAGSAPDIATMSDEELEDLVFQTVLAQCLVTAAEKHGAGGETRDRIFGALARGEPAPTFAGLARELGVPLVRVQHHHAHLAAVMAENRIEPDVQNVLGIILDGTGLGDDGTIWGGEFLLGGYRDVERVGHLEPIALAGGAAAVREPWRNTVAHLATAFASASLASAMIFWLATASLLGWFLTRSEEAAQ